MLGVETMGRPPSQILGDRPPIPTPKSPPVVDPTAYYTFIFPLANTSVELSIIFGAGQTKILGEAKGCNN